MTSFVFVLLAAQVAAVPVRPAPELRDRSEAYYHFSLGLQARFAGDTQTALDEYRKAQKLDPGSGAIRVETSRLLRETGKIDEALAEAREAVRLDKDSPDAHLALAQLYQLQAAGAGGEESLRQAAAEYEDVVRLQPTDGNTLLTLAGIYGQQLQNNKEAARVWELYLALDPGSFEAHVQLGTHLLAAGEPEKAAAALKNAFELQPGSARVYQILGDIYAQAEQTDQAVLHYRKALELEPGNVRVHLGLGEVLYRARRYPEALDEADGRARERCAEPPAPSTSRAVPCATSASFDEAEEVADALVAQDPSDLKSCLPEGHDRRGAARLRGRGHPAREDPGPQPHGRGRRRVRQQRPRLPDPPRVRLPAAEAATPTRRRRSGGRSAWAATPTRRSWATTRRRSTSPRSSTRRWPRREPPARASPTTPTSPASRPRSCARRATRPGRRTSSTSCGRSPRRIRRCSPQVADFYQRAKRFPDAESTLRQARELEPKNLRTLFQLGAVLERQKRHDDAEAVFREALGVEPDSAPILNYLGYMNADRGVRVDEALEPHPEGGGARPENGAYLDSLGWALYRLEPPRPAEQPLRQALAARSSKNAVVLDHLGDVLQAPRPSRPRRSTTGRRP